MSEHGDHGGAQERRVHYRLVTENAQLPALCAEIARVDEVAMDTEADNQWHFKTRLCLIQLEVGGRVWLVDLETRLDPAPLLEALASKHLVMHGSDFDLRLLSERGFRAKSIFDTMIAAQLLGMQRFGLGNLLEQFFGVKVNKRNQKANWSKRPLTPDLLEYAAMDVRLLSPLRDRLQAELERLGRLAWMHQRCEAQIEQARGFEARDDPAAWRIGGSERLRPQEQAVLFELWHWREREAQRLDWPPFKILQGEKLLELARRAGSGAAGAESLVNDILATKGGRRFRGLREAVAEGAARDPSTLPRRQQVRDERGPFDAPEQARLERYRARRDAIAEELRLDPTLIANKAQLSALVREPHRVGELLQPWQRAIVAPFLE